MKVGLITIGNELLSGFTVDTNSSWIGQSLIKVGARISLHLTVQDDPSEIKSALDKIPKDCRILLVTGGLGPTHDDITQNILFNYYNIKPVFDKDYWESLNSRMEIRGRSLPEINKSLSDNGYPRRSITMTNELN